MEKNTKKILAISVLGMFMLVLAMSFVVAKDQPGIQKIITQPPWLVNFIKFMGFGETWSTVIISFAVLLMIFAATYDILGFSAFESDWVKYSIAAAVAVVAGVANGVTFMVSVLMAIVGGSVAFATIIAIVIAIIFFVIGTFAKGRLKLMKLRSQTELAKDAFKLGETKSTADIRAAKAAADAVS